MNIWDVQFNYNSLSKKISVYLIIFNRNFLKVWDNKVSIDSIKLTNDRTHLTVDFRRWLLGDLNSVCFFLLFWFICGRARCLGGLGTPAVHFSIEVWNRLAQSWFTVHICREKQNVDLLNSAAIFYIPLRGKTEEGRRFVVCMCVWMTMCLCAFIACVCVCVSGVTVYICEVAQDNPAKVARRWAEI